MICKNCGFHNVEGDEFCGNCGQYLEWSGVKADDAAAGASAAAGGTDAGQSAAVPPPPVDDSTTAMAVPPPPPTPPAGMAPPPPPPTAGGASPQFGGRGPDIICWNCGRQNPGGRTFCIQCGERLTAGKPSRAVKATGVAAGAGATGAGMASGAPPAPASGGGLNLKWIGIGAGVIIALLIIAVVAASFLGGTTQPTPTPTLPVVAQVTPTPTGAGTPSPLASATALPTDTPTALPTDTAAALPTDTPTPAVTPSPTAQPTAKPTAKPTIPPTNAVCTNSTKSTFATTFQDNNAVKVLDSHTAWCVHKVVFTAGSGVGLLKLYLINSAFDVSPYGWLEARMPSDFGGGSTFTADLNSIALPNGYDNIPPGTTVQFKISCEGGPCGGSVKVSYQPISIP